MRVAIVGAGVIGLTTAVEVKKAFPGYEVKIFSDQFSPDTTGDGSAGLWGPYLLGDTPAENILLNIRFIDFFKASYAGRWAGRTFRWLEEQWQSGDAPEIGITLVPVLRTLSHPNGFERKEWTETVYGATRLTDEQLMKLNDEQGSKFTEAWRFVTYTCEPTRFLPWLMEKFLALGGKVEKRRVRALHELADEGYELVINCTGLGSRDLLGDNALTAIRGQVTRVKAPWALHSILVDDDDSNYIIPNIDSVVLGGTHQENDFDRTVSKSDSTFIYNGCCRLQPDLKRSLVLREWVGLRPGRPEVRLESEKLRTPSGREYQVIHNYGHGGSGVTLCWGCAIDVVEILRDTQAGNLISKL